MISSFTWPFIEFRLFAVLRGLDMSGRVSDVQRQSIANIQSPDFVGYKILKGNVRLNEETWLNLECGFCFLDFISNI